jgi:hypothetical protein
MTMSRLPNFIYIGTNKAGSTWLYDVLARHPDVYMAPGKGLYFFSKHYERGLDWYRTHFEEVGDERIVGEVSHSYMYSDDVWKRIAEMDPEIRLMVCLREPVDRAFADYLDGVKNGLIHGDFETELEREPPFLQRSHYSRYLAPYVEQFGLDSIHVALFDELSADHRDSWRVWPRKHRIRPGHWGFAGSGAGSRDPEPCATPSTASSRATRSPGCSWRPGRGCASDSTRR